MRLAAPPAGRVGALGALHARAFDRPGERAWSADELEALAASPGVRVLAAEADAPPHAPCGFLVLRTVAGEAEVLTVAVDPAARRRGVGAALVEAAAGAAAAAGAGALFLEVAADNAAACALYARAGFARAGLRRGYYARPGAPPVDALVLSRALNRPAPGDYPAPSGGGPA